MAEAKRDVSEQVEGNPAKKREGGQRVERVVHLAQRLLQAERDEHDAGDHREVQVGVGIAGQFVSLAPLGRAGQASRRDQRYDVEVDPPQGGRQGDSQHRGRNDARGQVRRGASSDGDDRLAQGDDDDQPVALGEMRRDEPPALRSEQERLAHAEQERQRPYRRLRESVEERRAHEQADPEGRPAGQSDGGLTERRVAAAGQHEEGDVRPADRSVGQGEFERELVEGLGHADRDDEEGGHGGEDRDAHRALLRIDDAGQPRVAGPRPPQHPEHEHSLRQP